MSWNNQNGGNRGNGGGPWGNQPGGGGGRNNGRGQQPPDLDELLRKGVERFRGGFPGGGLGLILVGLIVIGAYGATGFYKVETDELGVVLRFGKYSNTTLPGLHYHAPWPIETVLTPNVQAQQTVSVGANESESQMLTGDENIIDLQFNLQWRIANAPEFLFNVAFPEVVISTTAESVMREVVGQNTLTFVTQEGRDQVQDEVRKGVQEVLDSYKAGVYVDQVKLIRVDPHKSVVEAYRDVQAARADRERMRNEAETYANRVVPHAQGQAAREIAEAEAFKQQAIRGAEGEAQRFLSVYAEYRKAPNVTRRRIFLETMEEVMAGRPKVILDGGSGVVPYLPLQELTRKSGN
jgi:membrane protease subunit HflK